MEKVISNKPFFIIKSLEFNKYVNKDFGKKHKWDYTNKIQNAKKFHSEELAKTFVVNDLGLNPEIYRESKFEIIPIRIEFAYSIDKEFSVRITETLSRYIEVRADNEEMALNIVKKMYENEEIVLDASDFDEVDFGVVEN